MIADATNRDANRKQLPVEERDQPMAELTNREIGRRSLLEIGIDRVWRFFCSVRAAIYEIAFLALLVLIGTLRGSSVPQNLADLLPFTQGFVNIWYDWDVFRSIPFIAICTLLAVAIAIGGMINRAPGIWRAIADPTIRTSHGFLRGATPSAQLLSSEPHASFATDLTGYLSSRRYRVLTETHGDELHVYADKNRFGKLGTFPFHIALILIMVGGIVGARFGFRDTEFVISEGETRAIGHGTGMNLTLNQFIDEYNLDGSAKEYTSDLVLLDGDDPVKSESITVNNPLTYRSVSVYQSGFGQTVMVRVNDLDGNPLYEGQIPMGIYHSTANPDAPAGTITLPQAGVRLTLIGPDEKVWNQPELDQLNLQTGEIYLQTEPLGGASGAQPEQALVFTGQSQQVGNLQVEFLRNGRYVILQVGNNPGVPIFILASVLLVGGMAVTFYFPHRRIRGIVSAAAGGGAVARFAPMARREWSGQREFRRLLDDLGAKLDIVPEIAAAPSAPGEDDAPGKTRRRARTHHPA